MQYKQHFIDVHGELLINTFLNNNHVKSMLLSTGRYSQPQARSNYNQIVQGSLCEVAQTFLKSVGLELRAFPLNCKNKTIDQLVRIDDWVNLKHGYIMLENLVVYDAECDEVFKNISNFYPLSLTDMYEFINDIEYNVNMNDDINIFDGVISIKPTFRKYKHLCFVDTKYHLATNQHEIENDDMIFGLKYFFILLFILIGVLFLIK